MNNTVLIIEDNKGMRENTAEILELSNYKVLTAENGKIGLEMIKTNKPDLILCDIMMPVLDGYGVLRAIENNPDLIGTPFIFLTAMSDKKDFRTGMDQGADDYLTKPFSGDDLLKVVAARMKKSSLIKKTFTKTIDGLNDFINEAKSLDELVNLPSQKLRKKLRKKEGLYLEGDSPNYLYFVVSGKIKAFKTNDDGKEFITEIYKDGDFFGYSSLLENDLQKESASAVEDSEIALVSKHDFFQLLYSSNEVSMSFIKLLSGNLAESEEKLLKLAYDSARKKVAEALLFIRKKYQDKNNSGLSFPVNRENISSIAGLSPESVSRNLTDLREEGLIDTINNIITIKDLKRLETLKW
jgi:CRP-like cAMP-binding protein/FixJ family two-component response regulator